MSKLKLVLLRRIFPVLFCVAFGSPSANALDPDRRISQYAHTAWRVRDGAFAGAPTAIAQTTDGYVWIGTLAGLLRFDGIRFVTFTPPTGKTLPNSAVISLLGSTDGSLWIGTAYGLARWKNGELVNFPETAGRVNTIYEDQEGTIWIARSRTNAGGVCKVTASVATCYTANDGMPPYANVVRVSLPRARLSIDLWYCSRVLARVLGFVLLDKAQSSYDRNITISYLQTEGATYARYF